MTDMSSGPNSADATRVRHVLIADDDAVVQQILVQILDMAGGYTHTVISDTHTALVEAISRPFDLLIFDRNMPPTKGDRVIRALRSGATPNRLSPMILMTAEVDHPHPGNTARGEPSLYLPKPINPILLLEEIRRLTQPA